VLRREFRADQLTTEERGYWKEHVFDQLLIRTARDSKPIKRDSGRTARFCERCSHGLSRPKSTGAAGRDAIAVAERIIDRIEEHSWDGTTAGRHGAFAMPALPIIAGTTQQPAEHHERRRAG